MSYFKRCEVKNTYEEEQFEWEIANFFSMFGTTHLVEHSSPPVFFGDITWTAHLFRGRGSSDWTVCVVTNNIIDDDLFDNTISKVEFILGFKKVDGSLDASLLDTDDEKYDGYYHIYRFYESELMERKHEFTASDSLTITCTMKYGTSYYPQPKLNQSTSMKLTNLDMLSENFKNIFTNKGSCDVSLQVKNKVFDAHKAILMSRSPVFSAMFELDVTENPTRTINIPDCNPEIFQKFLQYLYCGKLEDISFQEVLDLYSTSDKFNVKELQCFCVQYMEQSLTANNVCDIIMLAEKNDDEKLLSVARRFFYKNSPEIVNTPKWKSLLANNSKLVSKLVIEMASKVKV